MHIRCPHCHNQIDVVNDVSSGDVSCPSCGSCFNLAKDIETGHDDGTHGKMLGHFQLLNCLGQGAFGTVWKARDTELDRIVAIKIPRKENLSEADAEKFLREARAAAQVRHPNIVSVHEVGREDGSIYIASDFIDGASLDEWVEAHPLTVRESVELCAKIAEALHHAHEAGVVHRDLKPQNILVTQARRASEGSNALATSDQSQSSDPSLARRASVPEPFALTPFITDFGLAKRDAGEITVTIEGAILGTPAYMPPEQARGEAHHADRRSDVYSLGVILFRLLTGELPFRGQRQMLIVQILSEEPPALRKLDARLPRDVETICLKCLEKDPARRYQSAAALAADLRRWLTGHPIEARPVSRPERAWRWCHRNLVVASLSAAIVVVLLTGMAVSSFFALQSASRNRDLLKQTTRANKKAAETQVEKDRADAKADQAQRHLYAARMNLAQRNWEIPQVGLVLDLLEKTRPQPGETDLRGFEWYYWDRLCHSHLLELETPSDGFAILAFSADGKQLASASTDQTVKVWDATSGQEMLRLKGHTGSVNGAAFTADGKRLASASADGTVKLWDTMNGQETLTLRGHAGEVTSVAFSKDGKRLASASFDHTVKVWDATSGLEMLTLKDTDAVYCVAMSADGKRLASVGYEGTVKVWDAETGQETLTLKEHVNGVHSVVFSADGERLAAAVGQTVKVWDATNGQEMLTLKGHTNAVPSVTEAVDSSQPPWVKGHINAVYHVAFSADGKRLASASTDQTVKVWDATSGQEMLTLKGHTGSVYNVVFTADGKRLASASVDGTVKVWDATTGQETHASEGNIPRVRSVVFSADGKRLVSASGVVRTWDATSGRETTLTLKGAAGQVTNVAFSPDGKRLASTSNDATVKVWDATSGQETLTLEGHSNAVYHVTFSADGKRLASASGDHTVKVWDATSGQETLALKGHTGVVRSVAFSADGKRLASASGDHTVKVWDAMSGQETLTLRGHAGEVTSVAYSPDGKRLASASDDKTMKVWDTISGLETLTLNGHTDGVTSVAFSADGNRIASASHDGTVKVWGARPLTLELRLGSTFIESRNTIIGR